MDGWKSCGQPLGGSRVQLSLVNDPDVDVRLAADHAVAAMDAFELFRKLGAGAKFDLKRFGQDAARFKVSSQFPAASLQKI